MGLLVKQGSKLPGHRVEEEKQVAFDHCCECLGSQGWPLVKPEESQRTFCRAAPLECVTAGTLQLCKHVLDTWGAQSWHPSGTAFSATLMANS